MKNKILKGSIFILSSICFLITIKLVFNMRVYVDEFNTSPDVVVGGEFWLNMYWLRLGISGLVCLLSGISFFSEEK